MHNYYFRTNTLYCILNGLSQGLHLKSYSKNNIVFCIILVLFLINNIMSLIVQIFLTKEQEKQVNS